MTTTLLFGDLRTGRIADTLDVTGCNWKQILNDAGSIDGVVVQGHEVRRKKLRTSAAAARSFLAVDVDGVIQEAGPIWSRTWDADAQELTLGAAGLWSLFDHRYVLQVLYNAQQQPTRVNTSLLQVENTDLGGIARALVATAMEHLGGDLPVVLPAPRAGDRTETFHGWKLQVVGDQLRQLTKREVNAPDMRFRPRYTADKLSIEWAMEAGTEDAPLLTQAGDDWFFDASVAKSPVVGISTDEDATVMGMRTFTVGNGTEEDILIAYVTDNTLIRAGWPLLELEESRSTVEDAETLLGHALNLNYRSARPIEVWKAVVRPEAAAEVLAGDYARVIPATDDPWLTDGETYMRVKSKSGGLEGDVTLEMYPVQAVL